jgi:hypothetical protein
MTTPQTPRYRSIDEIAQFVHGFEAGTLAPDQFNHHAHMTVALWYLARLPFVEATAAMRANVQHFAAAHHQSQLYHETITLFWMRLLGHILDTADPREALPDVTYRAISRFGTMQPFFRHYSKARAFSAEARDRWVDPDLLPLPFSDPGA